MDLTQLSSNLKLKTNFDANTSLGLKDINSVVGIVDNSVTSLQALIFKNDDSRYDDTDPTNYDITGIRSGLDNQRAFVFDLKKDYKFTLSSDITDHYVEDNVAIQDHIGLRPITLEVTGVISEINLLQTENDERKPQKSLQDIESPTNLFNATDSYLSRMGSLTSFAPNLTNQALNIYNSAKFSYALANKVVNMSKKDDSHKIQQGEFEKDESKIKQTKQCFWVKWFRTQWENRASFSIVTPYDVLHNMFIVEFNATQPENTRYITNISIKFKQIRVARTQKKFCNAAPRDVQLGFERGHLNIQYEDGSIIMDSTPNMLDSIINSKYNFSGSEILNNNVTSTYVCKQETGLTESQLEQIAKQQVDRYNYQNIKSTQSSS